jgi:hypothetical protein
VDQDDLLQAVEADWIAGSLADRALAIAEELRAILASGGAVELRDWSNTWPA